MPSQFFKMLIICAAFSSLSCNKDVEQKFLDVQGHRGCRGLYPENGLDGMLHALDLGVQTLEMDVVITADSQVILSHEPFLSHEICLDSAGNDIPASEEQLYNIFKMTFAQVAAFDCGSKPHGRFPEQNQSRMSKPLLTEIIEISDRHAKNTSRPLPFYNIEIKSRPDWDGIYHPDIKTYADLLVQVVKQTGISERTYIQSFDPRALEYVHTTYPELKLVLLIENKNGVEANLKRLTFKPNVYSCFYELLTRHDIENLQSRSISVIPWTVNEKQVMTELINLGVDGIITDYPDRLMSLLNQKES